jgi:hypothetical protein
MQHTIVPIAYKIFFCEVSCDGNLEKYIVPEISSKKIDQYSMANPKVLEGGDKEPLENW